MKKTKAHHQLEHLIFSSAKAHSLPEKFILAVSGGLDSMALLRAILQVFGADKFVVAHFHHGEFANAEFRNQAQDLVKRLCQENQIHFETAQAQQKLSSEAEFRQARNQFLCHIAKKHNTSLVVMAHHMDDWLETQLIKLIRGCSFESLNQNLEWAKNKQFRIWRPWIKTNRAEILSYAQEVGVSYIEDPTNSETNYLRNWIRHKWLKDLNDYRPGSSDSLAFSLVNSLDSLKNKVKKFPWNMQKSTISRLYWESLSVADKRQCLAYFFYKKKFTAVKRTQIEEIIKQLDKNQNDLTLSFKTFDVIINAEQVRIAQKNSF